MNKPIKFLLAVLSTAATVTTMHYTLLIPGAYLVICTGLLLVGLSGGFYVIIDMLTADRGGYE